MHNITYKNYFAFLLTLSFIVSGVSEGFELSEQRKMFVSDKRNISYQLALGEIKKINAAMAIEREVLLRGDVKSTTYEFDRTASINKAWSALVNALPAEKRVLFSCDGLACGSSNHWANDVFGVKQLYGLDLSQKYRAYSLEGEEGDFLVVYFVQRGNKRIHAQVEYIFTEGRSPRIAPSASSIRALITENGFYSIPLTNEGENLSFDEAEVSALRTALLAMPLSRFYLVGHAYGSGEVSTNIGRSERHAQSLLEQLQTAGRVAKGGDRFTVHGLGNLAPNSAIRQDRVVVLLDQK